MPRARYAFVVASVSLLAVGCASAARVEPGAPPPAAAPAAAPAQPAPPPPAPPPTARIGGRVLDRETGVPIPRARVELSAAEIGEARAALTDAEGRYEFTDLPAGSYTVIATKTGYGRRGFGQQGALTDSPPIQLQHAQALDAVDFRLARAGAIAGRLMDEDGRPLAWAMVEALRPHIQGDESTLVAIGTAQTDDLGQFRIFGLPPGDYFVSAFDPAFENVGSSTARIQYAPTYYPGVVFIAEARRVRVTAGAATTNVAFQLKLVRPAQVSGRIMAFDGQTLLSGAVIMSPFASGQLALGPATGARLVPDGQFIFTNVPPGRYVIRARGERQPAAGSLFATFLVSVEGRDIGNIQMTLRPGAVLTGALAFQGKATPLPTDLTQIWVNAPLADGTLFGGDPQGFVRPDGTFQLSVQGGDRLIRVENLPPPWLLRAVIYRGRDITDRPLTIEDANQVNDLQVVLTDQVTVLTGTIRNAAGDVVSDRVVVALPVDHSLWRPQGRHIRLAYSDFDGRFQIRGLPPGDYFVVVVDAIDPADLYDVRVMERIASLGSRVTLREGQPTVIELKTGPPESRVAGRVPPPDRWPTSRSPARSFSSGSSSSS